MYRGIIAAENASANQNFARLYILTEEAVHSCAVRNKMN